MIGRTNAVIGSGGSDSFAFIKVTYPAGSTCTCTNSTSGQILYAPDTTGNWVVRVPEAGSWVVLSVDGEDSASETVVISELGQVNTVTLSYTFYLFNLDDYATYSGNTGGWTWEYGEDYYQNGAGNWPETGTSGVRSGWVANEGLVIAPTTGANYGSSSSPPKYIATKGAIDLTPFSTCVVYIGGYRVVVSNSPSIKIGFTTTFKGSTYIASANVASSNVGTEKTFDISNCQGGYYFQVAAANATALFRYALLR